MLCVGYVCMCEETGVAAANLTFDDNNDTRPLRVASLKGSVLCPVND
jgi:hypothetical protein